MPPRLNSNDLRDCLKTLDLQGRLTAMDADGMCVMEIDDFDRVQGQPWASLWPEDSHALVSAAVVKALSGKVARFSADCPTAKGAMKTWDVSVSPIRDEAGTIIALQSLSLDVTERRRGQRETVLVSRELTHRIKNLLAVIDSMILLSARGQPEAKGFVSNLRQRLAGIARAIAFIHPMGDGAGGNAPASLKNLLEAILSPYVIDNGRLTIEGDDPAISVDALTSVALIFNELTTNAVKYGALRKDDGRLRIDIAVEQDAILIGWIETSSDPIVTLGPAGFGTSLLDRTVQSQLGGSIQRVWSAHGLDVTIRLPIDAIRG